MAYIPVKTEQKKNLIQSNNLTGVGGTSTVQKQESALPASYVNMQKYMAANRDEAQGFADELTEGLGVDEARSTLDTSLANAATAIDTGRINLDDTRFGSVLHGQGGASEDYLAAKNIIAGQGYSGPRELDTFYTDQHNKLKTASDKAGQLSDISGLTSHLSQNNTNRIGVNQFDAAVISGAAGSKFQDAKHAADETLKTSQSKVSDLQNKISTNIKETNEQAARWGAQANAAYDALRQANQTELAELRQRDSQQLAKIQDAANRNDYFGLAGLGINVNASEIDNIVRSLMAGQAATDEYEQVGGITPNYSLGSNLAYTPGARTLGDVYDLNEIARANHIGGLVGRSDDIGKAGGGVQYNFNNQRLLDSLRGQALNPVQREKPVVNVPEIPVDNVPPVDNGYVPPIDGGYVPPIDNGYVPEIPVGPPGGVGPLPPVEYIPPNETPTTDDDVVINPDGSLGYVGGVTINPEGGLSGSNEFGQWYGNEWVPHGELPFGTVDDGALMPEWMQGLTPEEHKNLQLALDAAGWLPGVGGLIGKGADYAYGYLKDNDPTYPEGKGAVSGADFQSDNFTNPNHAGPSDLLLDIERQNRAQEEATWQTLPYDLNDINDRMSEGRDLQYVPYLPESTYGLGDDKGYIDPDLGFDPSKYDPENDLQPLPELDFSSNQSSSSGPSSNSSGQTRAQESAARDAQNPFSVTIGQDANQYLGLDYSEGTDWSWYDYDPWKRS